MHQLADIWVVCIFVIMNNAAMSVMAPGNHESGSCHYRLVCPFLEFHINKIV